MITLNKKYAPLFKNDTRFFIITGGRGSSKSFGVGTFASLLSFETGHKILFTRQTMTSAHLSIIPEFQEKIDLMQLEAQFDVNKSEIVNKNTKSEIIFRGIKSSSGDQTANLKSLQGVTTWILDEAEELTDELTFDKINLSIRQKGKQNRVVLILNPATKEHWIYKKFFESTGVQPGFNGIKGNTTYIHTTYLDNIENLDQSFIDEVQSIEYTNPKKYEHVILGGWLDKSEGAIFSNWKVGAFVYTDFNYFGQDYGFTIDPTTLIETCIDKINKTIYVKEHLYKTRLTTQEIFEYNTQVSRGKLIIADSAEPRLISELKSKGNNIKGIQKPKIEERVRLLQDWHIVVDPTSLNIIKELNNYAWSDKKSETPIDQWNHCFVGETLITTNKGEKRIDEINISDLVLTSYGFKKVIKVFDNGIKKTNEYLMQFDTFSLSLKCTEDHKIKTTTGWVKIKYLTEKHIVYIKENTITQEDEKECIKMFGSSITEQYPKGFISTTSIRLRQIIELKTLCSLKLIYTCQNTQRNTIKIIKNLLLKILRRKEIKQKSGTHQTKAGSNIENKPSNKVLDILLLGKENASFAKVNTKRKKNHSNSVQIFAKAKADCFQELTTNKESVNVVQKNLQSINIQECKIVAVHVQKKETHNVYDLMIDEHHEYFANNLLVHNCLDPLGYVLWDVIGRPNQGNYSIS